jgi:hypothetical protein
MLDPVLLLIYFGTGCAAGVLAGLFGVGGGLIVVPLLAWVFGMRALLPGHEMHLALATSLAAMVLTGAASLRAHARRGTVRWPVFRAMAPGLVAGALGGALVAGAIPNDTLRVLFVLYVFTVAVQLGFDLLPQARGGLPGAAALGAVGSGIGMVSAWVGIGGGSMTVPYLVWRGVGIKEAISTSAACGLPVAAAGAAGYLLLQAPAVAGATGFVVWPATLAVGAGGLLFAPAGAWLAHRLPAAHLRRYFAIFLAAVGVKLLLN